MNKAAFLLSLFISFFALLSPPATASEERARLRFFMSKIYEHYRGIQADMKNTDLEDAKSHTSRIYRYLDEIPPLMPQKNTDGTLLNREIFIKRIKESQVLARELRGTLIEQNIEASQKVLGDMFQLCVSCHNSVLNKSKAKK